MGGKSSTSTQQVSIPPEVLARYNSVNATAEQAAAQPFQAYNGQFVAPLSSTQEAGIANTNTAAGQAQPYFQTATDTLMGAQQATSPYYQAATQALMSGMGQGASGTQGAYGSIYGANAAAQPFQQAGAYNMGAAYAGAQPFNQQAAQGLGAAQQAGAGYTAQGYNSAQPYNALATGLGLAGAAPVNAQQIGGQQIGQFMSPYIGSVLQGTEGILNQQNQQALSGQLGNAIQSGAFGGDRAGVAAANLAQQQQLANAQTYSGILNQGYGQALADAQQRQGVNLSAEQANRAALQQASGQMLGIGQQGYAQGLGAGQQLFGQGLSAAQQQAALGQQLYGQGMGLASAQTGLGQQLFGQGATTSQQQAALAQQQYAQGLGGASGLSSLGQNIYGTGAQTAQQLAALGTGAQGASLQGAQAQLAAGQTEQQTQQAQDTALYNQFLQQQSYPFQTAQFLANIAEGTGSLSGSTTTTTQPGGFFSDRRLKENVKPIGKTHDGQTIYSYNYKGDPRTQIGLMAQEVEKKHPDAVGLAGGYKTVDYAKATADAARTKRYAGGLVPANDDHLHEPLRRAVGGMTGGFDPQLAAELLSAQKGVYGGAGGPASAEGGPYGGLGRVPTGAAAQHQLQVAQPARRGPSAMSQAKDTASLLHDAWGAGEKVNSWLPKGGEAVNTTPGHIDTYDDTVKSTGLDPGSDFTPASDLSGVQMAARGGLIGARHRFAQGGLPYADQQTQNGLDIPDDSPKNSLQPAQGKGGPSSGQQDFNDVMDAAKVAAEFMALNRGGRAQRAAGGLAGRKGYNGLDGSFVDGPDDGTGTYDPDDPTDQRQFMIQPGQGGSGNAFDPDTFSKRVHGQTSGGGLGALANAATFIANPVGGLANMAMDELTRQSPQDHFMSPSEHPVSGPAPAPPAAHGVGHNSRGLNLDRVIANTPTDDQWAKDVGSSHWLNAGSAAAAPDAVNANNPQLVTGDPGIGETANSFNYQPDLATGSRNIGAQPKGGLAAAAGAPPPATGAADDGQHRGFFSGLLHGAAAGLDKYGQPVASLADGATDAAGNVLTGLGRGAMNYSQRLKAGDEQAWVPLLTGLSAMGTAPTRSLGVALATGVGAGAQAYPALQTQQLNLTKTKMAAENERYKTLQTGAPPGTQLVGGQAGPGTTTFTIFGKPYHYAPKVNAIDFGTGQPSLAPVGQKSISANYATGQYNISPTAATDAALAKAYGVTPTGNAMQFATQLQMRNPVAFEQGEKLQAARADQFAGNPADIDSEHRLLTELASTVNSLPQDGLLATGEGFQDRARVVNIYNTISKMSGGVLPFLSEQDKAVSNKQIIDKIRAYAGSAAAAGAGQHSAEIANALTSALPGGEHNVDAANSVLSNMLVTNQQKRDFMQYRQAYLGRYGTHAGLMENFTREFFPTYARDQQKLPALMKSWYTPGSNGQSPYVVAAKNPQAIQHFEQGGADMPGFGEGSVRYVQ